MLNKMSVLFLSILLSFSVLSTGSAYAASKTSTLDENIPTSGVRSTDPHHAAGLYNTGKGGEMSSNATDLLASESLDLYSGGADTLILDGETIGTETLDKIGYENITLQRWENDQWSNVKVWSTYEYNTDSYDYEYTTTVTPGYDYRYIATHYGEIDWLGIPSVETYYNETSYLHVGSY